MESPWYLAISWVALPYYLAVQDGSLVPPLHLTMDARFYVVLDGGTFKVLHAQATHNQIMVQKIST